VGNICLYIKPDTTLAESRDRRDNKVEKLIKRAVKEAGLTLLNDGGVIADRISGEVIKQILEADIVVMDTNSYESSDRFLSPLLYYLMAFSHTLGNKTVLVSDSRDHLQGCLVHHHTLTYNKNMGMDDFEKFSEEFCETVKKIQEGDDRSDNPIQDYLSRLASKNTEDELRRLKVESDDISEKVARMEAELARQRDENQKLKAKENEISATYDQTLDEAGRINFRPSPLRH